MIKLPFYDEIRVEKKDIESLRDIIDKSKRAKIPTYFFIKHLEEAVQNRFLFLFFEIVKEHNFNLYFPYPIYIISSIQKRYGDKNIIFKDKKDLPIFFKKDLQKLRAKELNILKKILLNSERVTNIDEYKKMKFLKENAKKQKLLFNLTKEFNFFRNILDEKTDDEEV